MAIISEVKKGPNKYQTNPDVNWWMGLTAVFDAHNTKAKMLTWIPFGDFCVCYAIGYNKENVKKKILKKQKSNEQ